MSDSFPLDEGGMVAVGGYLALVFGAGSANPYTAYLDTSIATA